MKKRVALRSTSFLGLALLGVAACKGDFSGPGDVARGGAESSLCSIPQELILDGGPGKDGIPALSNPPMAHAGDTGTEYLLDGDRVVGFVLAGQPMAIPLNIFWWHEIVNLERGGVALAVTHCPLTGSSLAFERSNAFGAEFGVSGLLFKNNLVMYDRNGNESLWPQMLLGARCGALDGTPLVSSPVVEMTWSGWRSLHPGTLVVSPEVNPRWDYTTYPYGNYDDIDNAETLFPVTMDPRRPPKERVLGIPDGKGGIAFPYGSLDELGAVATVTATWAGQDVVVFWDRARQGAMAFFPDVGDEVLTFRAEGGQILDDRTGSAWSVEGRAVSGVMEGSALPPVADAFVAFWFAWPDFFPQIRLWGAS
jgi:hypothetical protein